MSRLSHAVVIVPTYEEAENLDELVAGVRLHAPEADLLFVDDLGRDGTATRIEAWQEREPEHVHLIRRPHRLGLGSAYVEGFRWALEAGYDSVVQMDADLSHRPIDVPRLLEALTRHPVVVGSRYVTGGGVENWAYLRRLISRGAGFYARAILRLDVRDPTSGFCAWRREALEGIGLETLRSDGYFLEVELKYRARLAGIALHEVPIVFMERRAGKSKLSGRAVLEAAARVCMLAWETRRLSAARHPRSRAA